MNMLDINFIRAHPDKIKANNNIRKAEVDVDRILTLDAERRNLIVQIDEKRAELNGALVNVGQSCLVRFRQQIKTAFRDHAVRAQGDPRKAAGFVKIPIFKNAAFMDSVRSGEMGNADFRGGEFGNFVAIHMQNMRG